MARRPSTLLRPKPNLQLDLAIIEAEEKYRGITLNTDLVDMKNDDMGVGKVLRILSRIFVHGG